jgi:hypothetical protein
MSNLKTKPIVRGKMRNTCIICICETTKNNSILLHQTKRQVHIMCKDCTEVYIKIQLDELIKRREYTTKPYINCPGTYTGQTRNQCQHKINITFEKYNCIPGVNEKLTRLHILAIPGAVSCPNAKCDNIVLTTPNTVECSCISCDTTWCSSCKVTPFHNSISCAQYKFINDNSVEDIEIKKMVESGVMKLCPKCNHGTIKDEGCNKMHCIECHEMWCWLCGNGGVDYTHFNDQGTNKCAGKLFLGVNTDNFDFNWNVE